MNDFKPQTKRIAPSEWELILVLLSLDSLAPLYEDMGLELPDKEQFKQALRKGLDGYLNASQGQAEPGEALASEILAEVEHSLGRRVAEQFFNWAMSTFFITHTDQPQWSAWDIILPSSAEELPHGVSVSPEGFKAIAELRKSQKTVDVESRVEPLRNHLLSEWDAAVYRRYGFSNAYDPLCEDDFTDPFSFALSVIRMNRLQRGWGELMSRLSDDEKLALLNYGRQFLLMEEIEMPEPLVHPDALAQTLTRG